MTDLREALNKAFEENEEKEEKSTPTPQELMDETEPTTAVADKAVEDTVTESEDGAPAEVEDEAPKEDKPEDEDPTISRAPASWSPSARAAWNELPAGTRKEIVKREKDYAVGIQRYAETSKYGESVRNVLAPFQSIIRMEGADDVTAVANLAQTAATLRLGTPVEKAKLVASLINVYGVDINALDSMLAGEQVSEEDNKLQQLLDQKLAPFQQLLTGVNQAREQQARSVVSTVDKEIAEFEKTAEFIEDVREDMAYILETAAKRGSQITLKQAYDRAVASRDDLAPLVEKSRRMKQLRAANEKVKSKRAAAASLPGGAPGGVPPAKGAGTLRGALEEAWDAANGE
jgi:hypothetical protein